MTVSVNIRSCYICIPSYLYIVGLFSKLAYTVHISSAEGYTNTTFCILCGINSKHSDIFKKKGVHIKNDHQIICLMQ